VFGGGPEGKLLGWIDDNLPHADAAIEHTVQQNEQEHVAGHTLAGRLLGFILLLLFHFGDHDESEGEDVDGQRIRDAAEELNAASHKF